jgi:uncharacterized membrane-anchored protein YjiN (DUF445 family)
VREFAEAGIAGAIADWYAVVALFRRPLGLPLPHTAIIPNNKDRIAGSIGAFIELNFLTRDNVIHKVTQLDVASRISKWLSDAKNSRDLADTICDAIPATLNMMDDSKIRDFWRKILGAQFHSVNATRLLDQLLDVVMAKRLHRKFLGGVLASLKEWLSSNRSVIKAKVAQASRFTPGFFDEYVANRFVDGLILLISEMADNTDHEIWVQFDNAIAELRRGLMKSTESTKSVSKLLQEPSMHSAIAKSLVNFGCRSNALRLLIWQVTVRVSVKRLLLR